MSNNLPVIVASGATTTQTSPDITVQGSGVKVVLDMTSAGTGSVTLAINGKDPASGKYYNLLTGAAVSSISTNVYTIHPQLTAVANSIAKDAVPKYIQVVVTANNTNPTTYTVGVSSCL